ncbi:unnamed protein product [Orchesella dallaii]|uniref:Methyltransferase FkbM domain-containing protein n=1 Tax=Orchesella dallaii TaxID=48710 RepID=A0ABP1R3S4_9HEXA
MGKEIVKHRFKFWIIALFIAFLVYIVMFRLYPNARLDISSGRGIVISGVKVPIIANISEGYVSGSRRGSRVASSPPDLAAEFDPSYIVSNRSTKSRTLSNSSALASQAWLTDNINVLSKESQIVEDKPIVIPSGSSSKLNGRQRDEPIPIDIKYVEDNFVQLNQKDSQLIQYTRIRYLTPPSKLNYSLEKTNYTNEFNTWVASFFRNKKDGIFLEAGVSSRDNESNSLYLEKTLGWTGLLVECNPFVVPYLRSKHRKAWIADVCLSPSSHPDMLNFSSPTDVKTVIPVQAVPLYTILGAMEWKEVDYFSFDIGGNEMRVLKNFPFDLIRFKVIMIQVYFYMDDDLKELSNFLISKDFTFVKDFIMELSIIKLYIHTTVKGML